MLESFGIALDESVTARGLMIDYRNAK